jgi:hypothetical protein
VGQGLMLFAAHQQSALCTNATRIFVGCCRLRPLAAALRSNFKVSGGARRRRAAPQCARRAAKSQL